MPESRARHPVRGMLTVDEIRTDVEASLGEGNVDDRRFDTVVVAAIDMQGRMIGKHMTAEFFVDEGQKHTHLCEGLLYGDIEGWPHPTAAFDVGYKDFELRPDLATLRQLPWREKTAHVLCDILDKKGVNIAHSPRAILRHQLERLADRGYRAYVASELEFYVFQETYQSASEKRWHDLKTHTNFNHPDIVLIPSREEALMRALRNGLQGAGIPLECSLGEFSASQMEINVRYAEPLEMADRHVLLKHSCHEIAHKQGRALTFMAKYNTAKAGNSCHVHCSLWTKDGKESLFRDDNDEFGMSVLMRQWTAGLLKYAPEYTYFLAPFINSYKRFQSPMFAPSKLCWACDNRTSAFRLCGEHSSAVRIECRIGGADLNPYLAFAAIIAAGLAGIDEGLQLDRPVCGDCYSNDKLPEIPKSLRAATEKLAGSEMLKKALGPAVVEHYVHAARAEQETFDAQVTDWELMRNFERP